MDLLIFAHPENNNSHNAAIRKLIERVYAEAKRPLDVVDLYADNFDPLLSKKEYAGGSWLPEVKRYQQKIKKAEILIFVFPVWWYGPPAILKGFFDRIFTAGFAYNFKKYPKIPQFFEPLIEFSFSQPWLYPLIMKFLPIERRLRGKKAIVINTFGGNQAAHNLFGRAVEYSVDKAVLEFCGISPVKRINWFSARGPVDVPTKIEKELRAILHKWWDE